MFCKKYTCYFLSFILVISFLFVPNKNAQANTYNNPIILSRIDSPTCRISPEPPIFESIKIEDSAIKLSWINPVIDSNKALISKYEIYRRVSGTFGNFLIGEVAFGISYYIDRDIKLGEAYTYTVVSSSVSLPVLHSKSMISPKFYTGVLPIHYSVQGIIGENKAIVNGKSVFFTFFPLVKNNIMYFPAVETFNFLGGRGTFDKLGGNTCLYLGDSRFDFWPDRKWGMINWGYKAFNNSKMSPINVNGQLYLSLESLNSLTGIKAVCDSELKSYSLYF